MFYMFNIMNISRLILTFKICRLLYCRCSKETNLKTIHCFGHTASILALHANGEVQGNIKALWICVMMWATFLFLCLSS